MFLRFMAVEGLGGKRAMSEICTFKGIRYDASSKIAILSTEHDNHDYLMPLEPKVFEGVVDQIHGFISQSMMKPGLVLKISGSPLIRVESGSDTVIPDLEEYNYSFELKYGSSSWAYNVPKGV